MVLAPKTLSAILFVFTLASIRAVEPSAANPSLDAAKRDLLALPSSNRNLGSPTQNDLKIEVPGVPNPSIGSDIDKPSTALLPSDSLGQSGENQMGGAKNHSDGWLIDAFRAADSQARAQRAADGQHLRDIQRLERKSGGAAASNPFTPYMAQWLSPHDPVLLQITGLNQTAGTSLGTKESLDNRIATTSGSALAEVDSLSGVTTTAPSPNGGLSSTTQNPAAGGASVNPYLPAETPALGRTSGTQSSSAPFSQPLWAGNRNSAGTSPSVGNQPTTPMGANTLSKPKLAEPAYTPPTAPLIDERKYFPQLHRF